MKLVIIAAGHGSRLRSVSHDMNKTLLTIHGKRLIDILLNNAVKCGLQDVVIITGYQNQVLMQALDNHSHNLKLTFIHNPDWQQPNGISVLAAKPAIPKEEEYMISMSDHFYSAKLMEKIKNSSLGNNIANVGLDFRIERIFDLEDGMKVKTLETKEGLKVKKMDKKLLNYDAIDCGVFKCRYNFFQSLVIAKDKLKGSLSDACNVLINDEKMGGVDIGEEFWLDVDTPESVQYLQSINIEWNNND